jgi:hypothetical protein
MGVTVRSVVTGVESVKDTTLSVPGATAKEFEAKVKVLVEKVNENDGALS